MVGEGLHKFVVVVVNPEHVVCEELLMESLSSGIDLPLQRSVQVTARAARLHPLHLIQQ